VLVSVYSTMSVIQYNISVSGVAGLLYTMSVSQEP
jgi:hypothetical protein